MGNGLGIALAWLSLWGQTAPAPTPNSEPRYYLIQVRIIEVDEEGKQTVVASPTLQTTGDATGVTVDPKRGRKFEFHFNAIDPNAPTTTVGENDDVSGKPIVTADAMKLPPQRVTLKAVQQTRKEILKAIADQAGLQLMLDADTVAATAAPLLTPISLELQNTPVEEAIRQIVEPAKLNFAMRQDLVLIGATPLKPASAKATAGTASIAVPPSTLPVASGVKPLELPANPGVMSVRVYAVQDLVKVDAETQRPVFKPLIEQLQKMVTTETWDTQGGMATIRGFDSTVSLVVRQTPAGHDAVAKVLAEMRTKITTP
ncbi:MAG TPA: hypothetical protein VFG20_19870 [Planctomycetaceae bacterium]|nr:hypothetical protein [Planctomycetaceae bacterium]